MFQQLHFRSGIGGDSKVTEAAEELLRELDQLNEVIRAQSSQLEISISQVEKYQIEVQQLRQQIVQVEQQLRAVMAPTYLPHDREQAARDQQVGRWSSFSSFVFSATDYIEMARLSRRV